MSGALRIAVLALALFGAGLAAHAVEPDEILGDPQLERRARALSANLRCLVCQNQSIDDSDAPLARDLRILVRERLSAGASDSQVIDFIVARYGEFVLLKPRLGPATLLLWTGPLAVLSIAAFALLRAYRRRPVKADAACELSAAEKRKLKKLLDDV